MTKNKSPTNWKGGPRPPRPPPPKSAPGNISQLKNEQVYDGKPMKLEVKTRAAMQDQLTYLEDQVADIDCFLEPTVGQL